MRPYLVAAVAVAASIVPAGADAALVSYRFGGATSGNVAVGFTITLDTAALAAVGNAATGGAIDYGYSGTAPGLGTVTVATGLPAFLAAGTADQSIEFDPADGYAAGLSFTVTAPPASDPDADFTALTLYADGTPVGSRTTGGAAVPVLDGVPLLFSFTSKAGATRTAVDGTVRLVTATPVPEPATWAAMTAGFALVGAALRRRGAPALA